MKKPTDLQIIKLLLKQLEAKDSLLLSYRLCRNPSNAVMDRLAKKVYGKKPVEWAKDRIAEGKA